MSEKKNPVYFSGPQEYVQLHQKIVEIIQEDIGTDRWIMTQSFPPIAYPTPISAEAIKKLKELGKGVVVKEVEQKQEDDEYDEDDD